MSDSRFCSNHPDRLFKYLKLDVKKCTIQECQRQIPIIQQLCQKCLQKAFEAGQEQEKSDNYKNSLQQLKQAIEESQKNCNNIFEQQEIYKLQLKEQLKKVKKEALKQLDNLFKDLMKKKDGYDEMLEMIGQANNYNQGQNEFYYLTYENLKKYLDGIEKKQPHEFNNNALQFGNLIENFLHNQDMSFKTLKNDIRQIGRFNIDIFSQDENIRTFFGSLYYNQIIQSEEQADGSKQIKNIFIPIRNQAVINNPQQGQENNQQLQFQEQNKIFTCQDINSSQNNKNGKFKVEVQAGNGIQLIYDKLEYKNNQLINPEGTHCHVIVNARQGELNERKGEFQGKIDPKTLELIDGTLEFKNQKNNQTHHYVGKFNQGNVFFKGIKKVIDQNKETCYKGNFDHKLLQKGKGCIWIQHKSDQRNILKYLGGFHDGKLDSQGTVTTLCRQKYNNNTIFIGFCSNGQQKDGQLYYLQDALLSQLDDFKGVDFDEIDSEGDFKIITQILQSDQKYKIEVNKDQSCQIF